MMSLTTQLMVFGTVFLACSSTDPVTTTAPKQPASSMTSSSFTAWAELLSIKTEHIKAAAPVDFNETTMAHIVTYTVHSKEKQVLVPHGDFANHWNRLNADKLWFSGVLDLGTESNSSLPVRLALSKNSRLRASNAKRPVIILVTENQTKQPDTPRQKYSQSPRYTGVEKTRFIHFLEPKQASPRWVTIKLSTENADGYGGFRLRNLQLNKTEQGVYLEAQRQTNLPFDRSRSKAIKPVLVKQKIFPTP